MSYVNSTTCTQHVDHFKRMKYFNFKHHIAKKYDVIRDLKVFWSSGASDKF